MATKKSASTKKLSKPATTKTKVVTTTATTETKKKSLGSVSKKAKFGESRSPLLGAYIGEFIGTFILAAVVVLTAGEPLYVAFSLVAIVLTLGVISGAHVNPLLTIGAWVTRKINSVRAIGYIAAQFLGAALALVVLSAFTQAPQADAGSLAVGAQAGELFKLPAFEAGKVWYVVAAEFIGAVIFSLAVSSAIREKKDRAAAALTVGLGLFAAILVAKLALGYASTGGGVIVNPALTVALQAIDFSKITLEPILAHIVAPIVGGIAGFFLYDVLRGESDGGDDHLIDDAFES